MPLPCFDPCFSFSTCTCSHLPHVVPDHPRVRSASSLCLLCRTYPSQFFFTCSICTRWMQPHNYKLEVGDTVLMQSLHDLSSSLVWAYGKGHFHMNSFWKTIGAVLESQCSHQMCFRSFILD